MRQGGGSLLNLDADTKAYVSTLMQYAAGANASIVLDAVPTGYGSQAVSGTRLIPLLGA